MVKKKSSGRGRLADLLNWNKRPFVDKMLDDGESPNKVRNWCVDNGFMISSPTMYTYANKRVEALARGSVLERVLTDVQREDKEEKAPNSIIDAALTNEMAGLAKADTESPIKKKRLQNDLELLDAVMQKGLESLDTMLVQPKDFLKALELKHKMTGGAHGGMTIYGMEELKLREEARERAILAVLLEFVPEEKHLSVLNLMEKVTKDFYMNLGLGDEYAKLEEERKVVAEG